LSTLNSIYIAKAYAVTHLHARSFKEGTKQSSIRGYNKNILWTKLQCFHVKSAIGFNGQNIG